MKLLVNTLSTTNTSGRNVIAGHFGRLVDWTRGEHEFVFLHHEGNRDLRGRLPDDVEWIQVPDWTSHWLGRTLWQQTSLGKTARGCGADLVFMASGTVVPGLSLPQATIAMNPWALVPAVHSGSVAGRLKAWLQRRAYAQAVAKAHIIFYLSRYIRDAYVANAGREERAHDIAYCGLPDDVLSACNRPNARDHHEPHRIVCASIMAPHKGAEIVVQALAQLRNEHGVPAELHLVGGWPDPAYRRTIDALVGELAVSEHCHIEGFVSREKLLEHYRRASVFCLMSRCESFGIPAIEAQSFGTPVVSSDCCAIPEICGDGGMFPAVDDVDGTAKALKRLLTEPDVWSSFSAAAVANARRFTYEQTARPLLRMFTD